MIIVMMRIGGETVMLMMIIGGAAGKLMATSSDGIIRTTCWYQPRRGVVMRVHRWHTRMVMKTGRRRHSRETLGAVRMVGGPWRRGSRGGEQSLRVERTR